MISGINASVCWFRKIISSMFFTITTKARFHRGEGWFDSVTAISKGGAHGPFAVEVEERQRVVVDVGVEVGSIGKAAGVGGCPAASAGVVVAFAEKHEAELVIGAFAT